jgi:hypothetical protein
MKFGLNKCAKSLHKRGKLVQSQNIILEFNRVIQELKQEKTYKYLGTEKSEGIQHQQMKNRLSKEYTRRLRIILN